MKMKAEKFLHNRKLQRMTWLVLIQVLVSNTFSQLVDMSVSHMITGFDKKHKGSKVESTNEVNIFLHLSHFIWPSFALGTLYDANTS